MTAPKLGVRPVEIGAQRLPGLLGLCRHAQGLVIFAHGSGSSRLSPRNRHVAERLRDAGLATLLFDLLTPEEAQDRTRVFDIPLLAGRVEEAVAWSAAEPETAGLAVGLFGASTGAAAALAAAAELGARVAAVVSRGGRPDLADERLPQVKAPTLLIVGGRDPEVVTLNQAAFRRLGGERDMVVVQGATHLFEEPGALDAVVDHAVAWFQHHFRNAKERANVRR